jgi:hypothetical protein
METILVVLGLALFVLLFIRAVIKKTPTTPKHINGGGSGGDEGTSDDDTVTLNNTNGAVK